MPLPRDDFGVIAAILRYSAGQDARGIEQIETLWRGELTEGTARVIADLRQSGRVLGELSALFNALAHQEAEVRKALAAILDRRTAV